MRRRLSLFLLLTACIIGVANGQDLSRSGREALYAGQFAAARDSLRPLLARPDGLQFASLYFETFRLPGAYEEGLREVDAMLVRSPDDPYLLNARGRLLIETGRTDEARRSFETALRRQEYRWSNAVELADLMMWSGERRQAGRLFETINQANKRGELKTVPELIAAARAAARTGAYYDANAAYKTANQVDPTNVEVLRRWADLFREKYNEADAQRTYEEALERSAHDPEIYVGLARSGADFSTQEELAGGALAINSKHVGALNLMAELRILDGQYAEAEALLKQALAARPGYIETLAHLAAVYHLQENAGAFTATENAALTANPEAASFYVILAEDLSRRYRYPDAATFARKGVALNSENPEALASLGIALLRVGQTDEARAYLQSAFDLDPFNLFAGNTLTLLDDYASFRTLESEHFQLHIPSSEADVLGAEILQMAELCFDSLSARYPYRPTGKIQLEAYNDADDFAVRIAGVPHIGLLGVSFGDIVAVNTPRAQAGSDYNWARTLWHEIAHTMAIGVSRFHVPRWFTEGLSVYEELRARPEWGREMEIEFFTALDQNKLLPLRQIDQGFTRPSFPGQVLLSYYHASRVIGFVSDRYGFNAVVRVLQSLGAGRDVDTSFREATGQDLAALDTAFRADLATKRGQVASVLSGESSPFGQALQGAHRSLAEKDYAAAEAGFKQAIALYSRFVGDGDPYRGLAAVYRAQQRKEELAGVLESFLAISEHGAAESRELGELMLEVGKSDRAIQYFERSLQVEPYDAQVRNRLATLYEGQGRHSEAIVHRRAIMALDPADRAHAHFDLAQSLYGGGQREEAKKEVLRSLEIAPGFREAQRLLLKCVDNTVP